MTQPSTSLIKHALTLLARIEIEPEETAQRLQHQLEVWRGKSSEHEAAYQEATSQLHSLSSIAPQLQEQFGKPSGRRKTRQSLLGWGVIALCSAAMLKAGIWYWHQPIYEADYHTGIAEVKEITLPDGSQLALNAKTGLHVTLYRQKRIVTMNTGEARFEVTHNAKRPFHVETRLGDVEVVGTIFTVSDWGNSIAVSVEQGHVRFHQPQDALAQDHTQTYDLTANDHLLIKHDGLTSLSKVQAADASAWRTGWLVFNDASLEDALPAINAFRHQPFTLANEKTANLRLTGRFRARDQQSLSRALPAILPVTLTPQADNVEIKARR
ncbi:FecR family protein [Methylobacillus pratensis]